MSDTNEVNGRKGPPAQACAGESTNVRPLPTEAPVASDTLACDLARARAQQQAEACTESLRDLVRARVQQQAEACAKSLRELADRVETGEIPMQYGVVVYVAAAQDGTGDLHAKGINDSGAATATLVGMLSMAANRIGELRP